MAKAMVGVGALLSVAHRPRGGGSLHGHTYEVVAWFGAKKGHDACDLQIQLEKVLSEIDHSELPDDMTRAEDIGLWVAERLPGCRIVDVNRPLERIYVCVRP